MERHLEAISNPSECPAKTDVEEEDVCKPKQTCIYNSYEKLESLQATRLIVKICSHQIQAEL